MRVMYSSMPIVEKNLSSSDWNRMSGFEPLCLFLFNDELLDDVGVLFRDEYGVEEQDLVGVCGGVILACCLFGDSVGDTGVVV